MIAILGFLIIVMGLYKLYQEMSRKKRIKQRKSRKRADTTILAQRDRIAEEYAGQETIETTQQDS